MRRQFIPIYEYLTFDGRSSLDFGVRISGLETYGAAERDIETFEVAGRNGELTFDNGRYRNVSENYACFIVDDLERNIIGFRNWLLKDSAYHRLEDTYHPDEFRMARFTGPFDPDIWMNEAGRFEVEFSRMPQRWLKSGERPIHITHADGAVTLINPTLMIAKPKIIVTSGTGDIAVNGVYMTLSANNGNTVIDCEIQDAYEDGINRNPDLTITGGEYPELTAGSNGIEVGSGVEIDIYPRWWRL